MVPNTGGDSSIKSAGKKIKIKKEALEEGKLSMKFEKDVLLVEEES